ncbi:hypothetical protein [Pseudobacteriovorax antillogorgiicola]|uniref:Polyisoprenoid-binding protein YceI n=1 Tax=Pseudobacteriovorax antillogorgiicola TaxID=1513793 RepID=A0A1Y6BFA9_9BACT|nr:hypothetical protein [Pseudobacteriovorax antillogorgiicola]TCS56325.1 hypothetical protein EDD56_104147 [Pseudobacteriovorax antillogorgiicola]SMF07042.1 hypothetical protein SAMN06296036_104186 [Pseudobacteriovorax antillogorgiicola]
MRSTLAITAILGCSSVLIANQIEEAPLNLWQITYKAVTSYADGYTIEGQSSQFQGKFQYTDGVLQHIEGTVEPEALSSGLKVRDESILEIVFTDRDGSIPDLQWRSKEATTCNLSEGFWVCEVDGEFKIRREWQDLPLIVYISDYQGRTWVHAEASLKLSSYQFYENASDDTIKVADEVSFVIDLLGD